MSILTSCGPCGVSCEGKAVLAHPLPSSEQLSGCVVFPVQERQCWLTHNPLVNPQLKSDLGSMVSQARLPVLAAAIPDPGLSWCPTRNGFERIQALPLTQP